ncbi:Sec-independent protein translocase protein TatB [Burkholderiaceae bacterium FT117]|uniref:Sec-independent protein translocase protein TatB n=1 Tax=Zeimonas sediminis TaxID=2944268 RepID=UPI0023430201|nr:Sec-independent protein translocase protein TatB [Zeimonas sediminis]MCM5571823.1 Sec-independent protein translocase protein TatB [Zeimonas sediminis]
MFDFGFTELFVIGLVALVVLGPERLPRVARQAGQWMGKLQRYVSDVKSDINRQMELDELRNLQKEVTDAARNIEGSFKSAVDETQSELNTIAKSFDDLSDSSQQSSGGVPPQTDWDKIYSVRRTRDRIVERRVEREKSLGVKRPKRRA